MLTRIVLMQLLTSKVDPCLGPCLYMLDGTLEVTRLYMRRTHKSCSGSAQFSLEQDPKKAQIISNTLLSRPHCSQQCQRSSFHYGGWRKAPNVTSHAAPESLLIYTLQAQKKYWSSWFYQNLTLNMYIFLNIFNSPHTQPFHLVGISSFCQIKSMCHDCLCILKCVCL